MHSWNESFETLQRLRRSTTIAVGVVLLVLSGICYTFAQEPTQKTFHSAAEASHALFVAVKGGDEQGLVEILGGKKELVSSEDEVADKAEREQFAQKYQEMHRLVHEPDGTTVLYIGAENWPFPIPLMSKAGAWYFDSEAGMQEVVFRRVGDNEATAIETCHALVSASKQSDTATGDDPVIQYAKALVAGPATNEGSDNSAGDGAANMGESRNPFHGYYFRRLSRGGKGNGPARNVYIAYPAEYRSSGVMTFVVTADDVVYERDLGPDTAKLAVAMTTWKSSKAWHVPQ